MSDRDEQLKTLDEMQYLLERMLDLARRSAGDGCTDVQRIRLQQSLELLRGLYNEAADRYERGNTEDG